jgi:hypothetical protein
MKLRSKGWFSVGTIGFAAVMLAGCGGTTTVTTTNTALGNSGNVTFNSNSAVNSNSAPASAGVEAREPDQYQATVRVKVEATGQQQASVLPTLSANVARSGDDRRMEFTMPAGGRVIFLDKAGTNYLILPDKKQYAELTKEAVGFEVRRMLMPETIVKQAKGLPGVRFVGEEQMNGRTVNRYEYGSVTNTNSQAGQVETKAFLLVDKETGLPLRSETVAESQSGGSVQGFSGMRFLTEISDIKSSPEAGIFDLPTGMEKIEASQVRAQVDMIFNTLASFAAQMMRQSQSSQPAASPAVSPAR